jgi:hypothetical protein
MWGYDSGRSVRGQLKMWVDHDQLQLWILYKVQLKHVSNISSNLKSNFFLAISIFVYGIPCYRLMMLKGHNQMFCLSCMEFIQS